MFSFAFVDQTNKQTNRTLGQFIKVFVYDTTPPGGSGPTPDETETPTGAPTTVPPVATDPSVAPVEDATDTMADSSESMSAASRNTVLSLAGLLGAGVALVLL